MTAQETSVVNGVATTLSSAMSAAATSFVVTSASGFPAVPFYAVIDPENVAKREFVLVDTSVVATTCVMSAIGKRFLAGSAATSGLTHDPSAAVWVSPVMAQLFQDIHDRIDASYRPGGTDVAIADGGTGASSVAGAQGALQLTPGTYTASKTALDVETAARIAADATLSTAVGAETTRATAAESGLTTAVSTEASARAAADLTLARGEVGYAQVVADQLSISTVADLTSLTLTFTAVAGRRYRWTFSGEVVATVADGAYALILTDGSNVMKKRATRGCTSTAADSCSLMFEETPGAGSVTRKLRLSKASGTGTVGLAATATNPAFLSLEDIGPG